jgi:hypothetical protein
MKTSLNLWPAGVIAVFGLFFAGLASVVVIASTHRDSLVNNNYYEQELVFQKQIDAVNRAIKAGATLRLDAAGGRVLVTVPVEQTKQNLSGKITFYRASTPQLDREQAFAPGADGTQSVSVASLAGGPWQVRVSWNAGGQDYFLVEKIVL